jgi:hypothetical protein
MAQLVMDYDDDDDDIYRENQNTRLMFDNFFYPSKILLFVR